MKVTVGGDYKNPVLFKTDKATALLIQTDDGKPAVIFRFSGNAIVRYTRGEDKNFDEVARQLGLM